MEKFISKPRFLFVSFKKNILPLLFCLFTLCLVLFSRTNLEAAKNGVTLWATAVLPSLFPFFVACELLSRTNFVSALGKFFSKIMRPLFGIPGEGAFAFLMGLISGYPVGAKIVTKFRQDGVCTKEEGDRMLAFTNNSGPLFIIGTVGITLFGDTTTGVLLFFTHFLACISVGIVLRFFRKSKTDIPSWKKSSLQVSSSASKSVTFSDLGEILGSSIQNAISTILMIGGFVVLFSVLLSILKQSHFFDLLTLILTPIFSLFHIDISFITPIFSGILELTNGVSLVSSIAVKNISVPIILCAFLLGFGGISILLQVFSIIAKSDLSIRTYVIGKFLQGLFAAFYTYLALQWFPFLNLDITPVCAPIAEAVIYPISFLGINNYFFLFLLLLFVICFVFSCPSKSRRTRKVPHSKSGNRAL